MSPSAKPSSLTRLFGKLQCRRTGRSVVQSTMVTLQKGGDTIMSAAGWAFRHLGSFTRRFFGIHMYRQLPRGVDPFADIATCLSKTKIERIYDVGAHDGTIALDLHRRFPSAEIHCFEPVKTTFNRLLANLQRHKISNIIAHPLALDQSSGTGYMVYGEYEGRRYDDLNRLSEDNFGDEQVVKIRLDELPQSPSHRINYLKIDTEGGDLNVLRGATGLLSDQRIDLIQVEAGLSQANTTHVPFVVLKEFLLKYDYHLFGIYEQVNEWTENRACLRRADLVFASSDTLDANRPPAEPSATD
jgi:FkbM family methyltransferase